MSESFKFTTIGGEEFFIRRENVCVDESFDGRLYLVDKAKDISFHVSRKTYNQGVLCLLKPGEDLELPDELRKYAEKFSVVPGQEDLCLKLSQAALTIEDLARNLDSATKSKRYIEDSLRSLLGQEKIWSR